MLGALLILLPTAALAQGALEEGLALFDALEYEAAIPHLEQAVEDQSISDSDRARGALHLAIIHVAFGDEDAARRRFGDALRLDPGTTLPGNMSPHVEELFQEVRARLATAVGIEDEDEEESSVLMHTPPPPSASRARIEVSLDPARDVQIDRMVVRHRRRGEAIWFDVGAVRKSPSSFEAELPAPGADGTPVEYYVEAFNVQGDVVAQLASAAVPLVHGPPVSSPGDRPGTVETSKPIYLEWWFLAGTGAVVTGAILGGVLVAGQMSSGACDAPSGQGCVQVGFQ